MFLHASTLLLLGLYCLANADVNKETLTESNQFQKFDIKEDSNESDLSEVKLEIKRQNNLQAVANFVRALCALPRPGRDVTDIQEIAQERELPVDRRTIPIIPLVNKLCSVSTSDSGILSAAISFCKEVVIAKRDIYYTKDLTEREQGISERERRGRKETFFLNYSRRFCKDLKLVK